MTMTEYTPDKVVKIKFTNTKSISINQRIIPDNAVASKYVASWCQQGWKMKACKPIGGNGKPRGICVHNTSWVKTSNPDLAKQYAFATWPNCNMGGTMVHYYVHKTNIWQLLKDTEQGWHAADGASRRASHREGQTIGGNVDCIAIECIGEDQAGTVTTSEETTAALVAYLCHKYGLDPKIDVYTHNYFYSKKYCPAYILPHWDEFIKKVSKYYSMIRNEERKSNMKYNIGDVVLFRKGCTVSMTPMGSPTEIATVTQFGTIKAVNPSLEFAYQIGRKFYKEKDLEPYTIPTPKYKVGDVLYMKKGCMSASTYNGDDQQVVQKNQYGTCKKVKAGAKFAYKIGSRYYREKDLVLYDKTNKRPISESGSSDNKKSFKKGDTLELVNANLYNNALAKKASKTISGKYYVYDGIIFSSGKMRICPNKSDVGAKPIAQHVTGFVNSKEL